MADLWISSFYRFVNGLGFPDPIHAALVHMPMGLVVGAFAFALAAMLTRWKRLAITAFDCITLAFLFLFPVIIFGLMDWRHFYFGVMITPIKAKMILAAILFILCLVASALGFKGKENSKSVLILYALCTITVIGLGWFGARIVYGERQHPVSKTFSAGEKIFMANCNSCHRNGGNSIKPDKPLRNSDDLDDYDDFMAQIRNPEKPMPAFSPSQISDRDARELFAYLVHNFKTPSKNGKGSP